MNLEQKLFIGCWITKKYSKKFMKKHFVKKRKISQQALRHLLVKIFPKLKIDQIELELRKI